MVLKENMKRIYLLILTTVLLTPLAKAQDITIKSNLLSDITATLNVGAEWAFAPRWTLGVSTDYKGWAFKNNKKNKHWIVEPELRYWIKKTFNGHFVSFHPFGGLYNIGDIKLLGAGDYRYEGWTLGGGVGYGYQWRLSRKWRMEAEIGLGYAYADYDKYECKECGKKIGSGHGNFLVSTKVALSIIYVIK